MYIFFLKQTSTKIKDSFLKENICIVMLSTTFFLNIQKYLPVQDNIFDLK